jgi:hypothetical protein
MERSGEVGRNNALNKQSFRSPPGPTIIVNNLARTMLPNS